MRLGKLGRVIAVLSVLAPSLAACDDGKPRAQAVTAPPPAPQVTVSKPVKKLVSNYDEYVGRFVAVDFVECGRGFPATSMPSISRTVRL